MIDAHSLSHLIHLIYRAAEDQQAWPAFLAAFARTFHGGPSALFMHDSQCGDLSRQGDKIMLLEYHDYDSAYVESYTRHYAACSPWTRAQAQFPPGQAVLSEMLCPTDALIRTEFYQDWLRPQGLMYCLGGLVSRDNGHTIMLATLRSAGQPAFDQQDLRHYDLLQPHLKLALALHRRLSLLSSLNGALDSLPLALWLCNREGKVLHVNQAGRQIASRRRGLWIDEGGGLHSEQTSEDAGLQAAMLRACGHQDAGHRSGSALALSRPDSTTTLTVMLAPVKEGATGLSDDTHVIVFATDPDERTYAPEELLIQRFGLTRRQAQLAGWLMLGEDLKSYARHFDVAYDTARSHLKQVFLKTGARRQAELIRILLSVMPTQNES
ncbi:LuxR family transcriptional regulator [Paludibacterium sp. THUN1379]|uniref:helix-turn-helix transcriptional regulator n=1 Tax=Paludibacterium sp. THUN1379 TaxID=3112107 RepID=UPI00308AFDBA|nr:LuxR family transcriptional regulator [Paludibacterium sp. THUN1379]